jgi:hypothetical protein
MSSQIISFAAGKKHPFRKEKTREAMPPGPSLIPPEGLVELFSDSKSVSHWRKAFLLDFIVTGALRKNLRTAGFSNASGASKAHGALPAFHQDRHFSHPLGKFQHLLQIAGVLQHVPIIHLVAFLAFGLPGLLSVRSTAFTENGDLLGHLVPSLLAADVIDPEIEKIHQVQDDQGILRERVLHPFETGADFLAANLGFWGTA